MRDLTDLTDRYETMLGARDYIAYAQKTALAIATLGNRHDLLRAAIGTRAERFEKATVTSIGTGSNLAERKLSRDFLAGVVGRSVLGQLTGALSVPSRTDVPFAGLETTAAFVREGYPIPLAAGVVELRGLGPTKLALIMALSNELIRGSDERAVNIIDRLLRRALTRGLNNALLDDAAAVSEERPAGLLHGISPSGGGSPANLDDDLVATVAACRGGVPDAPTWVVSPLGAVYLQSIDARFQSVSMHPGRPGVLFGAPQIASEAAGAKAILIDASAITYSDDGMTIGGSSQTALQMDDAPTNNASTGTGSSVVSMFQTNSIAIKAEWYIHWAAADDAVAFCELPLPVGSPAW